MMNELKKNAGKYALIAVVGSWMILLVMVVGGCSTVSGIARDLSDMSEATRSAMVQDD